MSPENTPEKSPVGVANKRVTMSTIAEAIGVTKTTVSLALRNRPSVSKATTLKIQELANKLGYRTDPAISAIATSRWSKSSPECHRVMAYICHHARSLSVHKNCYHAPAKKRASELGYKLEIFYADEYPNAESITRVLYSRGIRGIIIPPIHNPNSKRILNLDWSKFTAVCCGTGRVRPPLHTVTPDTFAHTTLVWNVLNTAGYKRIGAVLYCHQPPAYDDLLRIGASSAAIQVQHLHESAKIPIHTGEFYNPQAVLEWYERYRPEVVLGFNESVGEDLEQNGIRIPEDVEFVNVISPEQTKWSGIVHQFDEIAERAVELLDSEIRHNQWGLPKNPSVVLVGPKWQKGSTLRVSPKIEEGKLISVETVEQLKEVATA